MAPETYFTIKLVHAGSALLSGLGFAVRGVAGLQGKPWVRARLARTLPHVLDSVLLGSALVLAIAAGFSPFNAPWLAAKIGLLLAYIGLGMVALSPRRSRPLRAVAFVAALLVFGHIVAAAVLKHPAGLLHP